MKKKLIVFMTICVLSINCLLLSHNQEVDYEEESFKPNFNFYAENMLSTEAAGRGYTGVASIGDISTTNINPASLEIKDNAQMYYEYGTKNDVDLYEDYYDNMKLEKYKSSVSVGCAYRISDAFKVGIIYNQLSSYKVDYGYIYNYDNFGYITDVFHVYEKVAISSLSFPVSYSYRNILRLGIGLDFNIYEANNSDVIYTEYQAYEGYKSEIDFVLFRPKIGAIVKPLENLSFGFTFLPASKKNIVEQITWYKIEYKANEFPLEIRVGTQYSLKNIPIDLLFDYKYTQESAYLEFKDRNDFYFGLEYDIIPKMHLRTGFFTQYDYRNMDYENGDGTNYWFDMNSYDKNYLTLGLSYFWRRTKFDIAIMDSHLLSENNMAQTHIKINCLLELAH